MSIFNNRIEVKINGYDLIVGELEDNLVVYEIKTTKQRKYRSLRSFYFEVSGEKENYIDTMMYQFARSDMSNDDAISKSNDYLDKLNIDKSEIIEAYRKAKIKKLQYRIKMIKNKEYK